MRLLVQGKWLKDQKRWSMVIPLATPPGAEKHGEDEPRKAPLKKQRAEVVPFRRRRRR